MLKIVLLMLAGGTGTVARYFLSSAVQRITTRPFPWGTLGVNVLGSLVFGAIWAVTETRVDLSDQVRLLLLIGFMGGFTTFSSFAFETTQLMNNSGWLVAAGNIALQNVLGIAAVLGGIALGRLLASGIENLF